MLFHSNVCPPTHHPHLAAAQTGKSQINLLYNNFVLFTHSQTVVASIQYMENSFKTETLHVATFQCVITAMETSGEFH